MARGVGNESTNGNKTKSAKAQNTNVTGEESDSKTGKEASSTETNGFDWHRKKSAILEAQEHFRAATVQEFEELCKQGHSKEKASKELLVRLSPNARIPTEDEVSTLVTRYKMPRDDLVRALVVKDEISRLRHSGLNTLSAIQVLTRRVSRSYSDRTKCDRWNKGDQEKSRQTPRHRGVGRHHVCQSTSNISVERNARHARSQESLQNVTKQASPSSSSDQQSSNGGAQLSTATTPSNSKKRFMLGGSQGVEDGAIAAIKRLKLLVKEDSNTAENSTRCNIEDSKSPGTGSKKSASGKLKRERSECSDSAAEVMRDLTDTNPPDVQVAKKQR